MNAYLIMFLFIIGIFGLLLFCFKFVCCRGEWHCRSGRSRGYWGTASLKVMKIFSHLQTRDQSQKVQNDKFKNLKKKLKIFVGGNGTFSHFLEKKLKKIWKKISKKKFFFTKICFSELEKAYVQLFVLNFFFV